MTRRHDDARRRHRPGDRHVRDDLHAGPVAYSLDAVGGRELPDEPRLPGQRQREPARPPVKSRSKRARSDLKLHEDWGTTPAAIDYCLTVADEMDVQVAIHTDTLNESGFVEDTIAAFKGRTIQPSTPKARAAAMRPTSSRCAGCRTCCRHRPIRRGPTPSTPSPSISTC